MERITEFVKEHIRGIAVAASIILVLAVVFMIEEPKPHNTEPSERIERRATEKAKKTFEPSEIPSEQESSSPEPAPSASPKPRVQNGNNELNQSAETQKNPEERAAALEYSEQNGMNIDLETGMDEYNTEPVPEGMPLPQEPENIEIGDSVNTCTLSVSCHEILENMDRLKPEKAELVPADGYILPPTEVSFNEGESVFNVLIRTMKERGIHMEFVNTPMYNSAYIEGINNLYEFDCGGNSGWKYRVNGWYPNYGCSRYVLQPGDTIEWIYVIG